MAAVAGDLLQLIDNQSYLGQQVLNVYYYRVTAPLGIADPYLNLLNDDWETKVLNQVVRLQSDALSHNSREWRNLSNGTDLFTDGTVVLGDTPGADTADLPSFLSLGFMLQRTTLAVRNGYKRFAGIPEQFVTGNTYVGPVAFTDGTSAGLASDLNIGILSVAEPVIVKRPIVVPVTTYVYSSIDAAQFRGVGTQNSRKAGRGV